MDSTLQTSTKEYFDLYFSLSTYQPIIKNLIYLIFIKLDEKRSLDFYIKVDHKYMDLKTIQYSFYSSQISIMPKPYTS